MPFCFWVDGERMIHQHLVTVDSPPGRGVTADTSWLPENQVMVVVVAPPGGGGVGSTLKCQLPTYYVVVMVM